MVIAGLHITGCIAIRSRVSYMELFQLLTTQVMIDDVDPLRFLCHCAGRQQHL
jgi:hypothetical protein